MFIVYIWYTSRTQNRLSQKANCVQVYSNDSSNCKYSKQSVVRLPSTIEPPHDIADHLLVSLAFSLSPFLFLSFSGPHSLPPSLLFTCNKQQKQQHQLVIVIVIAVVVVSSYSYISYFHLSSPLVTVLVHLSHQLTIVNLKSAK